MLQRMKSNGKLPCILFLVQSFMAENKQITGLSPRQTLNGQRLLRISGSVTKICTWNVRTLYQAGKAHNVIQEMKRMNIKIMGISEMRWPGTGQCLVDEYQIYFSGTATNEHQCGVGFIVEESIQRCVSNFTPISGRVALLQINTSPVPTNIIQIYAPTADKSEEEIENFYEELLNTYRGLPKQHVTIIMGDFNAKIGQGRAGECIGPYGLGERNERGDRLNMFATEEQLVILNTFYKLPPRRLYTWKAPMDSTNHVVRNQIDFMLVNKRYRNSFVSVKTYPGADIMSDHNPLVGAIKMKMKKINKRTTIKKYDIKKLKDPCIQFKVREDLTKQMQMREIGDEIDLEIKRLKDIVEVTSEKHLKPDKNVKRKSWMTDEIMQLMEQRRLLKNKSTAEYLQVHKLIQKRIKEAKNSKLEEDCKEIEALQEKHDSFNVHKKVKEAAGIFKHRSPNGIMNSSNNVIVEKQEKIDVWKNYIKLLFDDARPHLLPMTNKSGPPITAEEVRATIRQMKEGKAPGPDNFHSEFLKLLDDNGIKQITHIFNRIYETGNIPKEWLKSEFITLPKKPGAKKCEDFRTISLMSHLLKAFLKTIHRRIYKVCEEHMSETQFGFRDAVGTREAIFSIQVLFQRCRDVNCDVYACFVDYRKAFDRVQHHRLMEILKQVGIDDRDLRIIAHLYWNQTACINVDGDKSEAINILRGVRQGCVLSPLLFNIYSEHIFNKALETNNAGILVNGKRLNNLRYADDTVIIADSLADLQETMTRVVEVSREYGLDININKTKYMVISKNNIPHEDLIVSNNQHIKRINKYTYLGSVLNDQWNHSQEIRCRIEKARAVFVKMASVFKNRYLTITTKVRLLRCYVFSILLYGAESWTVTEATMKKLTAFEMWLYRRILRISWVDHVTNEEVLRRMKKPTEIITTIKTRKLEYLGHIMRNEKRYGLLQEILQGKIPGKRGPGRRRISWLKNLRTWFSVTTTALFRAAVNKITIARMIANVRTG